MPQGEGLDQSQVKKEIQDEVLGRVLPEVIGKEHQNDGQEKGQYVNRIYSDQSFGQE